ncbi:MAG TPA: xanthine dehydrogenase small subunit [Steroidobacteraceae bacterium]|nr:xanthine dehydrogenase small subunit [Steroidobacteraceae bacterium]
MRKRVNSAVTNASTAVRFLLDGVVVTVDSPPPTLTVLEYLREHARRTGTKEGCAEGDCGACTVVLGEPDGTGGVRHRAINSCIRFLATIDGCELITVESLQAADGTLHPVQQAMVDCHASQCGFCTPGFVMSLYALYLANPAPTAEEVVEALAGNLCRCTGYRPLIEAGCRMGAYPEPGHRSRAQAHADGAPAVLDALRREQTLSLPGFVAPRSGDELAAALLALPDAVLLAGGTDVGLWVTKQLREIPQIIYLGAAADLGALRRTADGLTVGAAVTLTDAWPAIVEWYPALAELAQRFGSPPVRNSGTLCGNIANGSPIGDSMPALMAVGAEVNLRRGDARRTLPLDAFYPGYRRRELQPGEFVESVRIPAPVPGRWVAGYKLAKRIDQDISAVCVGIALEVRAGRVTHAHLAFGGMAAVPKRAQACERALLGEPWNAATLEAAAAALAQDFQPLTDPRGSSGYRLQAAGNLLRRFQLEHPGPHPSQPPGAAVRTAQAEA